jgi:hypothetical protein
MKQNLNLNSTQTQTKLNQIIQVIKQYIDCKIDISQAADKIVDILFPWYEHYVPLLSYNIDPWASRARDVLHIEDILAVCGDISSSTPEISAEIFIECVVGYLIDNRAGDRN